MGTHIIMRTPTSTTTNGFVRFAVGRVAGVGERKGETMVKNNKIPEPISDAGCQERVERIKGEIERKSWNTPYISIDEQLAGKEPVVYREVKMEEAQWQSLWDRGLK